MKKRVVVVVVLLAALLLSAPAGAERALLRETDGHLLGLWVKDGVLHLIGRDARFSWAGGEAAVQAHPFRLSLAAGESLLGIAPGGDALWAYIGDRTGDASLAEVLFDADGAAALGARIPLDRAALGDEADCLNSFMALRGYLAFVFEGGVGLYDLGTGAGRVIDADAAGAQIVPRAVFPYGESAMIAGTTPGGIEFYTLDIGTGVAEPAFTMPTDEPLSFGAPAGDGAALTFVLEGNLVRVEGLDPDTAQVIGDAGALVTFIDSYAAIMDDGTIVIADWRTALAYDEAASEEALQLSILAEENQILNHAYYPYLEKYPEAQVKLDNRTRSYDNLRQSFLTRSVEYDICHTNLGWPDYGPLYERGYLPSLSESAVLAEFAEGLHPAIRAAVEKDGALVALPLELSVEAPAYNPAAFAALGLTDEDVPTTWPAFFALLARVPALTEGTDYTAFDASLGGAEDLQYLVFHELLQAYELYLEQESGLEMRYNTPILRAALAAYEEVDFSALGGTEDWAEPDFDWALAHALFALPDSFSCDRRFTTFQVMPLSLAEGVAPMLRGKLDVAILNPDAPNRAAALRYLETALEGMPPLIRADMDAGWDAPIKFEGVDASISQAEERIAQLEAELERASADDKAEYQRMLDGWRESLAGIYETYWAVSEEDVRAYQAHAPDIRIWRHFGLDFDGLEALSAERSRYFAGEIDAETLLQNMDKKVNMMLLEN